jgi:glycosyltransferase involved in cell wall biosynthesis
MKVLHVLCELCASGMEEMLRSSAPEWRGRNVSAEILATGESVGPFAQTLREAGYPIHHVPFQKSVGFFRRYRRLLQVGRYDVVHVHSEGASFYYALLARLRGIRVVLTVHANFEFRGLLALRRSLQRRVLAAMGCRRVSVSESVRATELCRFGVESVVIPNWYDAGRFASTTPSQRALARQRLGITEGEFAVVSVGNCHAVKNHDSLLRALSLLGADPDWVYLHAGREEQGRPELTLAKKLGIESRVRFLGEVRDVPELLRAADVFVMPSLREGLGVATLEALACGCTAVLTDVPGLSTFHGVPGVVWADPTPESIVRALAQAAATPAERRRQLGMEAGRRVAETYGLARGVRAYEEIYKDEKRIA